MSPDAAKVFFFFVGGVETFRKITEGSLFNAVTNDNQLNTLSFG